MHDKSMGIYVQHIHTQHTYCTYHFSAESPLACFLITTASSHDEQDKYARCTTAGVTALPKQSNPTKAKPHIALENAI